MSSEEGAIIVRAQTSVAARLRAACHGSKEPISYEYLGDSFETHPARSLFCVVHLK